MPTYDANGIPNYKETDVATPGGKFSALLNLLADAVGSKIADIVAAIATINTTLAQRNVWITSNPTAAIVGITLGTGGTVTHRWRILDGILEAHFTITLGTPGWNLQVPAELRYNLPTGFKQADNVGAIIGQGWLEDISVPTRYGTLAPLSSEGATSVLVRYLNNGQFVQAITNTAPFTFAGGDKIKGYIRVPVVPI